MIISQHAFCPLGFIPFSVYNSEMELVFNSSHFTSVLSPCYGSSFVQLISEQLNNFRCWSPYIYGVSDFITDISLKSVFLFSKAYSNSFPFVVSCLNF